MYDRLISLSFSRRLSGYFLIAFAALLFIRAPTSAEVAWLPLEGGLDLAVIEAPIKSAVGNSRITVLRIDPKWFRFRLISAKELKSENRPAHGWAKRYDLVAAINAGMFRQDYKTSVGYMRNASHINNPNMTRDFNVVLAFNRRAKNLPPVQIIDLKCQDFATLKPRYDTLVQSLRMVDCKGRNRWGASTKMWSTAAIAETKNGRVLFIHARSPYQVRVFIGMLLRLPLAIRTMMYVEGGPEATLYVNARNARFENVGSYETGFREDDTNREAWPLPNVIGIVRKKQPKAE